jgi:hypothetical protein
MAAVSYYIDNGYLPIQFFDGSRPKFPFIKEETVGNYMSRLSSILRGEIVKAASLRGRKLTQDVLKMTIEDFLHAFGDDMHQGYPLMIITQKIDPDAFAMLGGRRRHGFRHSRSKSRRSRAKKSRAKRSKTRRSRTKKRHM